SAGETAGGGESVGTGGGGALSAWVRPEESGSVGCCGSVTTGAGAGGGGGSGGDGRVARGPPGGRAPRPGGGRGGGRQCAQAGGAAAAERGAAAGGWGGGGPREAREPREEPWMPPLGLPAREGRWPAEWTGAGWARGSSSDGAAPSRAWGPTAGPSKVQRPPA